MKTVEKKITEIFPYANNPRNNEAAVEKVANSIREFGFQQPIVVDKKGVIVAGHTRYLAAKSLGLEKVPCVVSELTDKQNDAYRLADNKTAEIAEWDFELLGEELDKLKLDIDMSLFGFNIETLDIPQEEKKEADSSGKMKYLEFGSHKIPLTDEELAALENAYDSYIGLYGVEYGFVNSLFGEDGE